MDNLTLYEYGEGDYDWSENDLLALQRLNETAGIEVLRAGLAHHGTRKVLQAGQYAGVVRLPHCTVQILPKIYRATATGDERVHEATRNLLYMLSVAGPFTLHEYELAPLLRRNLDWLEILTHLFASHLAEAWQRGAAHAYQDVEAELNVLRGKWRMSDHLRRPSERQRLPVRYAEFTADNAMNRVLRYVVEQLWHTTRDDGNRRRLADLRIWMDEVSLLPALTVDDAHPTLITRLNQSYAPLLNLARVFLGQGTLQLAAGETLTYGLLLDMALLFQEFIVRFIGRHRDEVLPAALQTCELLPQGNGAMHDAMRIATRYLAHAKPGGEAVFGLHPDLAFHRDGQFPVLLDTKYKLLPPGRARPQQDDLYQAFTYAHGYGCPRVVLLYPQVEGSAPVYQTFEFADAHSRVDVATVNLQMDLRAERQAFTSALRAILEHD